MKISILSMAVIAIMSATISTSYGQVRDQKSFSEREDTHQPQVNKVDAKQDYKEAQRKSDFEFQKFRKESQAKIRDNERKIAVLKWKISKFHSRDKAEYQKNLKILAVKNAGLKRKITNYRETHEDKWRQFKREFNHDINEVEDALKDFKVDNKR